MRAIATIIGRTRANPLTREDYDRSSAHLVDPTMEITVVNVCRCRQPEGPFDGYHEVPGGWAVTVFDGILTLRCHVCREPMYYIALGVKR